MRRQTYLVRKGARYHFRRRRFWSPEKLPITIALGTADPATARKLANRLAVKWDELEMHLVPKFERGNLTLEERDTLFKKAMTDELALATDGISAPMGDTVHDLRRHKIMEAAYRIVSRLSHDSCETDYTSAICNAEVDKSWTRAEREALINTIELWITPMSVSRADAANALRELRAPVNHGTCRDARSQLLNGKAEAHARAALFDHPSVQATGRGALALLDDLLIASLRCQSAEASFPHTSPKPDGISPTTQAMPVSPTPQVADVSDQSSPLENPVFLRTTSTRFSEIIEPTLNALEARKKWAPDNGQRKAIAERFAWLTGDKPLSQYDESDVQFYVDWMYRIPNTFRFGKLHKSGPMAEPFDADTIPDVTVETKRNDRTINRDLSALQNISRQLGVSIWRGKYSKELQIDFLSGSISIEDDPSNPDRMPWTPEHLKTMYQLPLWQGGGGKGNRVKNSDTPKIYQDAAYWAPLIATHTGMSREEVCGLEVDDFNFECAIPYLIVQANMTRSKDGINPGGLKTLARGRIMPLHPALLRLNLQDYVSEVAAEQKHSFGESIPIFPELYSDDAKGWQRGAGSKKGGKQFYSIAWCYIADATHAVLPLPETREGKKADFHSQRTYNQSVLAAPDVSRAILARHMGHAQEGTGPKKYDRRSLALGEEQELRERLQLLKRQMPQVTDHVPTPDRVNLLPLKHRSRVGSAAGRDARRNFCA